MGGRVKRNDGYKVDDFVADNEEEMSITSESEYLAEDSDSGDAEANTRPKRKTKDRSVKKTTSFKPRKGDAKAPVEQPARRIVRTSKKTMGDVANDDELKALISAGTDSESYDPDISEFDGDDDGQVDVSDFSDDEDDQDPKISKKQEQANANQKKKLPSVPLKAEPSPPTLKRTRDTMEKRTVDTESFTRPKHDLDIRSKGHGFGWSLSNLAGKFGMTSRRGSDEREAKYQKLEDDFEYNGPYYV